METLKLSEGSVKVYEESLEFCECRALMLRLALPPKLCDQLMDDEIWFCRASLTERELYLLFEGLEKFTDALKLVPGWALESC